MSLPINMAFVVESAGVALSAAQRAVDQLESSGIVRRVGRGERNRVWLAPEVIIALDAFAERAGKRG